MEKKAKLHYAWVIVICCACISFLGVGIFANSLSTWTPTAYTGLGVSLTLFSVYYTFQNGTLAISQVFVGRLINKLSLRMLAMISVTLSCGALALMSVWPNVYCWWISGILNGLGLSVTCYILIPVLMNNWFAVGAGSAMGICMAMTGIGGAVFSPIVGKLIANPAIGWRPSYLIMAAISWVPCIIAASMLRLKPADKGLEPYGIERLEEERARAAEASASKKHGDPAMDPHKGLTFAEALRSPVFYVILLAVLAIHFVSSFQPHITNYAVSVGFPVERAATVGSIMMIGMFCGKFGLGAAIDRFGVGKFWTLGASIGTIAFIMMLTTASIPVCTFIACFMFGCAFGMIPLSSPNLTRRACGPKDYEKIFGLVIGCGTALNAFAPTIYAYLFDSNGGSYLYGIIAAMTCLILSTVFCWIALRLTKDKWNLF
ncbi:MAG: MFS transporter [Oscillospiraceae bacterium]